MTRVYRFGDSLVIEIAEGQGEPRMTELAAGVWVERDREGRITAIELLIAPARTGHPMDGK